MRADIQERLSNVIGNLKKLSQLKSATERSSTLGRALPIMQEAEKNLSDAYEMMSNDLKVNSRLSSHTKVTLDKLRGIISHISEGNEFAKRFR